MTDSERIAVKDYLKERLDRSDKMLEEAVERVEIAHREGMKQLVVLTDRVSKIENAQAKHDAQAGLVTAFGNAIGKWIAAAAAAVAAYLGVRSGS